MKVSFISSQAVSQALRYQTLQLQGKLVNAQKEMTNGRVADVGLALGARTGVSVSLHREIARLEGLKDSNAIAASRLSNTQLVLKQLTESATNLLADFTAAVSDASDPSTVKQQADAVLATLTSNLNSNVNGEHLFAGINTDVKPINDFSDPASPNNVALHEAFVDFFGFATDHEDAATITPDQMDAFLDSIESQFLEDEWEGLWSNATDQTITSRITLTETAQTSVSANSPGFRKLAMATATISVLFGGNVGEPARKAALNRSIELIGEVVNDLGAQQSAVGISEQRVERASERMTMQVNLFSNSLLDLEGVDELEAVTRFKGLEAQLNLSYELTVRMQQMSLLNFLR